MAAEQDQAVPSAQELFTPEALRRQASGQAPTRPGEGGSPARSTRSSNATTKPPGKMRSKLRRCGHTLSFVPWLALLALAAMVGGLAVFAIKGKPAADTADALLQALGSPTSSGFPLYMRIFEASVWATVGVAGAAVAMVLVAAIVRTDLKFRRANKYSQPKGQYGPFVFRFFVFLSWLGLLLTVLLALWAVVVGVLLSSWSAQCWNLEKGAAAASANIASLDALGTQYEQALDSFAASVMDAASGKAKPAPASTTPTQPPSAGVVAATLEPAEVPTPTVLPPAAPVVEAPAPTPMVEAPAPTPAAPVVKAPAPKPADPSPELPVGAGNTTGVQVRFAATPAATTVPAAGTTTTAAAAAVNATLTSGIATLQKYANSWVGTAGALPVQQVNGTCPSAACLNLAAYPFTESGACVCNAAAAASLSSLADSASEAAVWALVGVAGLFCGALFGGMEAAKDHVLLGADQLFLTVMRRKSRRTSSSSGGARSLKGEDSGYHVVQSPSTAQALTPANPALRAQMHAYSMMARTQ